VLPPLLTFARHDPKGRSFQVVTPLFWRFRDRTAYAGQGSQQIVAGAAVRLQPAGPAPRRRRAAAAVSFFGRDATRRYQVIAPLLFGHVLETTRTKWHDTWVFGPVYAKRTIPGWHGGLMPLAAFGRDDTLRYTVLPPLLFGDVTYVKEQRRLTISPVFARSKSPEGRTLGVLNLFWDVKRKGDERHTVMFPLYYRRQHADRVLTLTPLGGGLEDQGPQHLDGDAAALRRPRSLGPGGAAARQLRPDPAGVLGSPPGRRRGGEEPGGRPAVRVSPRAGRGPRHVVAAGVADGDPRREAAQEPRGVAVLLPPAPARRDRRRRGAAPLPFFHSRDPVRHTHTLIAGPFFHRLSRTSLNTGVVPLAWWMDSEKRGA
jgi:hypothetical protein